jgi:hypothetical protein
MSVKSATQTPAQTPAMTAIFKAEQESAQTQSPMPFHAAVRKGVNDGLDFQTIEKALRVAGCQTFLIARKPEAHFHAHHIQSRLPGDTKNQKYWLYAASGSHVAMELFKESQTYEENFAKLKETGFAIQVSDAPPQAGYKNPYEWTAIKDPQHS